MTFDPCPHQVTQIVLKAGGVIRQLKGLPEEKNLTVLYNETARVLGIEPERKATSTGDRLPSPAETKDDKGKLIIPRKDCAQCKEKESMSLFSLCATCADAEGGKYKSKWECSKCGAKEIYEMPLVKWLDVLQIDFKPGMKAGMGIKTATNEGIK